MALREGRYSVLLAVFQLLLIPQLRESQQEATETPPKNLDKNWDFKPWSKSDIFGSQPNSNHALTQITSPQQTTHGDWI